MIESPDQFEVRLRTIGVEVWRKSDAPHEPHTLFEPDDLRYGYWAAIAREREATA